MPTDAKPIPFDEFVKQLDTIFDESEAQGSSRVLVERGGMVFSVSAARRRRRSFSKPEKPRSVTTPRYSLLDLVGLGASAEPTDIGRYKHEYLAEAAADLHDAPAAAGPTAQVGKTEADHTDHEGQSPEHL